MKTFFKGCLAAAALVSLSFVDQASAGSSPNWTYKYVPTTEEWNSWFARKQDDLGYTPLNSSGGIMSGRLITAPSNATTSGLNMTPGSAPASPVDGDVWVVDGTGGGIFVRVNGATVGPMIGASGTNFAASSPLSVTAGAGVVTYSCPACGVIGSPLSQFAATTSAQLAGVLSDETGTGLVVFSTSPVLTMPNLGTPSAAVLTNATGLPVGTGISGMGSGIATFLATPSSANLFSAMTTKTGTGSLVFGTGPALANPVISGAAPASTGAIGFSTGLLNWFDGSVIRTGVCSDCVQTLSNKTISGASNTLTVRLGSDVTGMLLATNFGALTGDVTSGGNTYTTVLTNIPNGITSAGSLLVTNITAPATPAAGKTQTYIDSTDKRFHDKNDAGAIGTTVVSDTGSANNFLTAIASNGAISKGRPACANLSDASAFCNGTSAANLTGTLLAAQFPALTSDVTTTGGSLVTTISSGVVTNSKLANSASGATLKGNPTASGAAQQDFTITGLTARGAPDPTNDKLLIFDNAAGTFKSVTPAQIASSAVAGVSSIAGNSGAFTLAGGVTNSTNQIQLDGNYTGFALKNCTLAASIATNILTVALKDNAGNDPSSTSPCYINYRNVTASTGSTTLVSQTSALSINTFATGATLGSANNTALRFWVVSFNNAGTNVLALFNASQDNVCLPIDETIPQSSTPISGSATSIGVYYTPNGTTISSKSIRIIGYIEYNSTGLATAGTYATAPNFIQVFGSGVHKPCDTIQAAYNNTTSLQTSSGATFPTATSPGLTRTIPMTSAANLVRVHASAAGSTGVSGSETLGIYRSTSSFACTSLVGTTKTIFPSGTASGLQTVFDFNSLNKPNTLSPIYGFCFGVTAASGTVNGTDLITEEIMG